MKAVPVKLNHFRKVDAVYYVGIDGVFPNDADAVAVATVMLKKMMQIKAYCSRYGRPVYVLINSSRCPRYVHTAIKAMRLKIISIVDKDADAQYGEYVQVEDPMLFIGKNSDVVLFLQAEARPDAQDEGEDADFGDLEVPVVNLIYALMDDKATIQTNPNEVVKNFKQPKPDNGEPYAAFYHEPLFKRVPYNYWQELMDSMPDTKGMGTGIPTNVW